MILRWLRSQFPTSTTVRPPRFRRRVIWDRLGVSPYLARFYLMDPPTMPDGSDPFEVDGSARDGIEWNQRRVGLFLHHFYRSDDDGALHNHPWKWAVALVLRGGYSEERRTRDDRVVRRVVRPGAINVLTANTFHRVDLLDPHGAWTLFVVGPKAQSWGFWDRGTKKYTPWREFIDELRCKDPLDDPDCQRFLAECAKDCRCDDRPCAGVTAGGMCDELRREDDDPEWDEVGDECDTCQGYGDLGPEGPECDACDGTGVPR